MISTNIKEETLNIFNVLATPTQVFEEITREPRWRIAFLFVIVSNVAIGWFMIPAIQEPMRKIFARSFGDQNAGSAVSSMMRYFLLVQMVVEPLFKFLRWVVFASVLYVVCRFLIDRGDCSFKRFFSIVAYSEIIFILMSLLNILVVYALGLERIQSSSDLTTVNKGLEIFFAQTGSNTALMTLLSNLNIFSFWYIIILSIGVGAATGLRRYESIGVVGIAWLIWIVVSIVQPIMERGILTVVS